MADFRVNPEQPYQVQYRSLSSGLWRPFAICNGDKRFSEASAKMIVAALDRLPLDHMPEAIREK